jgi:hypothetical protein
MPQVFVFTGTGLRCSEMPGQVNAVIRLFAAWRHDYNREALHRAAGHHGCPGNDVTKPEFENWRNMGLIDLAGKFNKISQ